jgi:hypothetical protein
VRRAALLALLACSACPRQLPLRFGPEGEIRDPAVLLHTLRARGERLQSLTASARVTVHGPHGGTTGMEIAAKKPSFLRVEVDGFFGNPVALLATDGRRVQISRLDQGVFAEGAATAANLARLLPAALPPDLVVGLLLADPLAGGGPYLSGPPLMSLDPARRAYVLRIYAAEAEGAAQVVYLDTETLAPIGTVAPFGGYEAWFRDPEVLSGVEFPQAIEVRAGAADVEIHYKDVQLDPQLDDAFFHLSAPAGARLVPLDG